MKSLLKIGSGIVILVVLFFALFSIFLPGEKGKKQEAGIEEKQTSENSIQSLNVSQTDAGVFLEIVGGEGMNYMAKALDERTLLVEFPQTPLNLERKMIPLPHPMIELIEAEEAGSGSKVKVTLTEPFEHNAEVAGNMLMIRFNKPGESGLAQNLDEQAPIEEPIAQDPPKPVVRQSQRPAPAPKRKAAPAPAPAPEPDDLISELGFDDAPPADTGDDLGFGGTEEDLGFEDSPSGDVQPDDLALSDGGFGNEPGFTDEAASIDDAFAANEPAAQQPNIDTGAALANLPSITNISVDGSGRVSINHEGGKVAIKRFLRRPNQAVVEIKDVSLNKLQVSQSAGGNVTGIKTEQFVNPQGSSISRVFILLSQMPDSRDNIIVRKGRGSLDVEIQGP
ncbi:MAG TPA: hypothetical protein PKC21_01765 [Oligoflexia bacterium]|nr:hypothetical protein [Oligoflexia bacterium]HMR24057.1 hypothetical protein [Oligoflexia bacterium]